VITNKELLDKYNTGRVYISPATMDWFDTKIRTFYYCLGTVKQIARDLIEHLLFPPTERCYRLPKVDYDGILRPKGWEMTDEEKEWLFIEHKLREALKRHKNGRVQFICVEVRDGEGNLC